MPRVSHFAPFACTHCGVHVPDMSHVANVKPHQGLRLCAPCHSRLNSARKLGLTLAEYDDPERRTATCVECGSRWHHPGTGRLPKRCDVCNPAAEAARSYHQRRKRGEGLPPIGSRLTCPTCGDEFTKTGAIQRFCSIQCSRKAEYARIPPESAVCDWCGRHFQRVSDRERAAFSACSPVCRAAYMTCVVRGIASHQWPKARACIDCGTPYPTKSKTPGRCPGCRNRDRDKSCADCGAAFTAHPSLYRCEACREVRRERWKRDKGNRHLVHRDYIIERDKGRCQVCRCRVVLGKPLHPRAAEIDHIIPKSLWPKGMSGRDAPSNLRLLCRTCNATKSNGTAPGGDQLLLIG